VSDDEEEYEAVEDIPLDTLAVVRCALRCALSR
jgi:hypothetical protein